MGLQTHIGTGVRDIAVGNKKAAASHLVFVIGIGDEHIAMGHQPAVAIDAAEIGKIELSLRFAHREIGVVAVVGHDRQHIFTTRTQTAGYVDDDGQITTKMLLDQFSVQIDTAFAHNPLKVEETPPALQPGGRSEPLAIPGFTLIVGTAAGLNRHVFQPMGDGHHLPVRVVIIGTGGLTLRLSLEKAPGQIHGIHFAPGPGQFEKAGS